MTEGPPQTAPPDARAEAARRMGPPSVLVLDTRDTDADLALLAEGWPTERVNDAASVLEKVRTPSVGAVVIAPGLDDERRELLTRVLRKRHPQIRVVHLTPGAIPGDTSQTRGGAGVAPWPISSPPLELRALLAGVHRQAPAHEPAAPSAASTPLERFEVTPEPASAPRRPPERKGPHPEAAPAPAAASPAAAAPTPAAAAPAPTVAGPAPASPATATHVIEEPITMPVTTPDAAPTVSPYRAGPIRCLAGEGQPSDPFGEPTLETGPFSSAAQWRSTEGHVEDHGRLLIDRLRAEGRKEDARLVHHLLRLAEGAVARLATDELNRPEDALPTALLVGIQGELGERLARAGVTVELADNVAMATALVSTQALDMVLVPAPLAAALLERVRRQLHQRALPVVVIGAQEADRRKLVTRGADEVIVGTDLELLDVSVRRILERAEPDRVPIEAAEVALESTGPSGWIGNLEHLDATELFQLLESGGRSASVRLSSGEEEGEVGFHAGRLLYARWGELLGMPALVRAVSSSAGLFRVTFAAPTERNLTGDATALLVEAMRQASSSPEPGA